MPPFRLPAWTCQHRITYTGIHDVPRAEIDRIKNGLARLQVTKPEVSIVIPAYNEEANILHTLSSVAALRIVDEYPTELLVVNDASTDGTQELLDLLGVRSIRLEKNLRPKGARQKGLELARGVYLLQADADSLYPPGWGIPYVEALKEVGTMLAYGNHAFIPGPQNSRAAMIVHELMGDIIYRFRKRSREFINVHGFNSAFRREDGLHLGSYEHSPRGSEDGHMALLLSRHGKLKYISHSDAMVWTSDRRIMADGGIWKGFLKRAKREGKRLLEYGFSPRRKEP